MIDYDKFSKITTLYWGRHDPDGAMCVMEAVAYVAGEEWSDHPKCTCPVISAFMRAWNDALLNDNERTARLLPFVPKLIGTKDNEATETCRKRMIADWEVEWKILAATLVNRMIEAKSG